MLDMENAEEIMQILERFTRLKQKEIPKELDDYMHYVAKSGDTVFKWASLKYLFREKLLSVIKNFHDTTPRVDDLPQYPNVDPFNYESMKSSLIERLELFNAAPFTIQRLCELLTEPRKQYSRIDKFMRALEKNILVVSTIEPGRKHSESENGDSLDSVVNGDISLDVNVDIDMETEPIFNTDSQSNTASSVSTLNPTHKPDDDILPNPKKPKLDISNINDEVSTTDVNTKTTVKTVSEEPQIENAIIEKLAIITDKNCEKICDKNTVSDNRKDTCANEDECIKNIEKVRDDLNSESGINITEEITKKLTKENENSTPSVEISKTITPLSEHTLAEAKNIDDTNKTYKEVESKNDAKKEAVDDGEKTDLSDNEDADPKSHDEENDNTITKSTSSKMNDNSINILTEQAVLQPEKIINVKGAEVGQSSVDKQLTKNSELSSSEDISVTDLNVEAKQTTLISTEQLNIVDAERPIEPAGKINATAEMSPITEPVQNEYNEFPTKVQPIEEKIKEDLLVTKAVQSKDIASLDSVGQSTNTDQPMDDNTDLISEIDHVVDNTANVDEIVMTDSVEMTTETIEPCKEEPAGMEIDDTSQEAMDQ